MTRMTLLAATALALAACTPQGDDAAQTTAPASDPAPAAPNQQQMSLAAAVSNPDRAEANRVRDVHRHPAETLAFFGLEPGMTVVEFSPAAGYYAEILSPFLSKTGGAYIATGEPMAALADAQKWGTPTYVEFGPNSGPLAPAGSADMVLTFRNIHNLMGQPGLLDKFMSDSAAALKPGGVLGVVEHRADPRPEKVEGGQSAADGYVAKATIVTAAQKAGLVLDGESEINANPKDTKDHKFGVWTLPPTLQSTSEYGAPRDPNFDSSPYVAIGESDRHTLRFRKPA